MAQSELKIAGMKLMIEGGAQFTADLNTAKTTSKMLTSELKLLEAGTTSAGKNGMEFLRAKSESLSAQLVNQEQKTKILKSALDDAATATEVDAKQVTRLENEVMKSQIAEEKLKVSLINVSGELGKATNSALQHGIAQKKMGEDMKAAGDKAKAAGDKIAGVGSSMTMMLTVPIAAAGVASIKLASDYEESLNKVNVAYKDNAQEVIDWSNTTLKNLGLAKGTALDMAAKYGDMATAMGLSTSQAAELGQELVGRAADLASFKNVSIDIANTALTGVFTGEGESLKQLGIVMLDANLAQYALETGHKTAWKEMANGEKVLVRAAYVMEMSKNSAGDFANTIDGTANQSRLFGESLKELGQTFGKDLLPVITPVIKGANTLIQSFGDLDSVQRKNVVGVALAVAAAGPLLVVVGKGIGLYGTMTTALGVHKIALATATIATETLAASEGVATVAGAGMMATLGPIAIVAGAAVAGFAAAGIIAANTMTDAEKESQKLSDELKKLVASCNDSETAFKDQSAEMNTNAAVTQKLSDKLYTLAGKENKSNEEKKMMTSLVSQLNDLMPELNLTIDEHTGALSENKQTVDDWIESEKKKIKLQVDEERWQELYKQNITITDQKTAAQKRLTTANAAFEAARLGHSGSNDEIEEMNSAQKAVDLLTASLDINVAELKVQEDAIGQSGAATVPYTDSILGTGKTIVETNEKIVESTELTAEQTAAALKKQEEDLKEQEDVTKQYYDDLQQSFKDHLSEMGSLESENIERNKLTAKQLKENRDQQVKDYQDWRAGLKLIAEKVPGDVLAELEKLGPTYDQIIDDLAKMSPEQIAAWVESYRAPAAEAAKAAEEEIGKLPAAAAAALVNAQYALLGTTALEGAARAAGRKTTAAYIAGLQEKPTASKNDYLSRVGYGFASYDIGTKYVPYDQLALIHKGEAVIPAAENPYNAAVSLGGIATNRAMERYSSSSSSVVNNSPVTSSTNVSLSVANLVVREEADIDRISTQLAAKVAASRKAVGS